MGGNVGEAVKLHLHPHGIVMVWPAFWAVTTIGGGAAAAVFLEGLPLYLALGAAGVIFVWRSLARFIVWRSTHYIVTAREVLLRRGVITVVERWIAFSKINDIRVTQGLLDRVLRCGTLVIESAGELGRSELPRVPRVIAVKDSLMHLVGSLPDRST